MEIQKETAGEAAQRMRLLISYVEDRIGTEFVYSYSPAHGKLILVRRGSPEDRGDCGVPPGAYLYLSRFLRFCVYGPDTALEGVVWALLCPITLPIMIIGMFVVGIRHAFAPVTGNTYVVDGGGYTGEGLFDEVSTRRREDLQFLLGTGKYAKENW